MTYLWCVRELESTKSLASSQRGESSIVITSCCTRIAVDLRVEGRRHAVSILVVVVEELELHDVSVNDACHLDGPQRTAAVLESK
jgi:hypothetical protein